MGQIVISAYRPKPGQEEGLLEEVRQHMPILRGLGLVSDRPAVVMRAADGTIVELFEWLSAEALASAHENEVVQAMWGRYAAVCDYVRLADLAEAQALFATFAPLDA
jgi:hypothetical protein